MDRASSTSSDGPGALDHDQVGVGPGQRPPARVAPPAARPSGHSRAAARPRAAGPLPRSGRAVQQVGVHRPAGRRHQLGHRPGWPTDLLEQSRHRHPRVGPAGHGGGVDRPGTGLGPSVTSASVAGPPPIGLAVGAGRPTGPGRRDSTTPDHTAAATSSSVPVPSTTSHAVARLGGQATGSRRPPAAWKASRLQLEAVAGAARAAARRPASTGTSMSTVRSGLSAAGGPADQPAQLRPRRAPARSPGRPAWTRRTGRSPPTTPVECRHRPPRRRAGPGRPP